MYRAILTLSLSILSLLNGRGVSQCFANGNCSGAEVSAMDQRACCVETSNGFSYHDGNICRLCIVHCFLQAEYSVEEDTTLETEFRVNVKGITQSSTTGPLTGTITAAADGTAGTSDFEQLQPIHFTDSTAIHLPIVDDRVTLEYDDRVLLRFTPDDPGLIQEIEAGGEYIRDTATVTITDNDVLQIFFDDCDYLVREGSPASRPLHVYYHGPVQTQFSLLIRTLSVDDVEQMDLDNFIQSQAIDERLRATPNADFMVSNASMTVPAVASTATQILELTNILNVYDDDINEEDQIFVLAVELGPGMGCFLLHRDSSECVGQLGAIRIVIQDNDPMVFGFTSRSRTFSEGGGLPGLPYFQLSMEVAAQRQTERNFILTYRLNERLSTVTAGSVHRIAEYSKFDVLYGNSSLPDDPLDWNLTLRLNENRKDVVPYYIVQDFLIEADECFTVKILHFSEASSAREPSVICGDDGFFCEYTLCITDDDEPFTVGFTQTTYTVLESAGSVEVCVQLVNPVSDIFDETVVVSVMDHPSSVYIPAESTLATPDPPDILGRYMMGLGTDYAQQTLAVNALDDHTISQGMRIVCYNQTIYDDVVAEGQEYVGLSLHVSQASVLTQVQPVYDQAAILILDNDGLEKRSLLDDPPSHSSNDGIVLELSQQHTQVPREVPEFSDCYTSSSCSGSTVRASSAKDCCVGTDDGLSFFDGVNCRACIVHGFSTTQLSVEEGNTVNVPFQLNVKGLTQFGAGLTVFGRVTAAADGTGSASDFEQLPPLSITNEGIIEMFAMDDFLTLEYNDAIKLEFTPTNPNLIPVLEDSLEYIRITSIVKIIDTDKLDINFYLDGCDHINVLEGSKTSSIGLEFKKNQNPFTISLRTKTIDSVERMGLGFFINSMDIQSSSVANADDVTGGPFNITVPANSESINIPGFFTVIDDDVDEDEQSFAVVAEIGTDVPDGVSCFQTALGGTDCHGRRGATEIRITDNDPMVFGFTSRIQTVSEGRGDVQLLIDVASQRPSERVHSMRFHYQEFSGNAKVEPVVGQKQTTDFDALFGTRLNFDDPIEEFITLQPETDTIPLLETIIINDFVEEEEECYTIRIVPVDIPGRHELITCNDDDSRENNFFCQHTICITDNNVAVVGLEHTVYKVMESEEILEVCARVYTPTSDCPIPVPFTLMVTAFEGSAENRIDFIVGRTSFLFSACDLKQCMNVSIIDDMLQEQNEAFSLSLMGSHGLDPGIILDPSNSTIVILNSDNDVSSSGTNSSHLTITATSVALVILVACGGILCAILVVCLLKRRQSRRGQKQEKKVTPLPEIPLPEQQLDLIQQLQKQLRHRNMIYSKHHLQLTKVVGEGESGLVYQGYINGEIIAVKTGKALLSVVDRERLLKEVTIMLSFNHPNVMSLKGMCFDGEVPLLIMPFMSGGSVLDYVSSRKGDLFFSDGSLEEEVLGARKRCLDILYQIAKGMNYLARNKFVHRDLAARNCMIDGLESGVIKVGDFGLTEDVYGSNYYRYRRSDGEQRMPIRWMAPESIEDNIYNEASDVWSFGVTCWEVFTCGRVPYTGVPVMTLLTELHSGQRLERPGNCACSNQMWEIMTLCWLEDPKQRPAFSYAEGKLFELLDSDPLYLRL